AFTRAAGTDQCVTFSRLDLQRDVAKSVDGGAGIAEVNVVESNSSFRTLQCFRVRRVLNRNRGIQNCEDTFHRRNGPLHDDPQLAKIFRGVVEDINSREKSEKPAGVEIGCINVKQRPTNADGAEYLNERAGDF